MGLTPLKEILRQCEVEKSAVGCFNALNVEMARGIVAAAERLNRPVILSHAEVHNKYISTEEIGPILAMEAKKAKVPVAVMLDHGITYKGILTAMMSGFNAVMIDASRDCIENNIKKTNEIVRAGRALNIGVEAELGFMPRRESGGEMEEEDKDKMSSATGYTSAEEAQAFVEATDVDALAISFGTMHGLYQQKPELDFERIKEIYQKLHIPLVMHGSSGLGEETIRKTIDCGIRKINYYTDMSMTVAKRITKKSQKQQEIYIHDIIGWMSTMYEEEAYNVIRNFSNQ